jgi:hypothetical protein
VTLAFFSSLLFPFSFLILVVQNVAKSQSEKNIQKPGENLENHPSRQEFGKTRLNATVGNRDCDPFTLKKRTPFFACFAFFRVFLRLIFTFRA